MSPAARIASIVAASVLLSGCGDSESTTTPGRTVDDAAVESGITRQLSSPSAKVTSVKCPNDVKSEAGATFKCSVGWSNGATGKVKVTETSLNHFAYEPVSGSVQVPGATVESSVQEQLAKQGAPNTTVNCPDSIIVKVGTPFTCNVSGGGGKAAGMVTFTFSSADGTVDPSSVKTD
jgi:hypothetical protein